MGRPIIYKIYQFSISLSDLYAYKIYGIRKFNFQIFAINDFLLVSVNVFENLSFWHSED